MRAVALALCLAFSASPALAGQGLPDGVERMLRQAALTDGETLGETAALATAAYPELAAEIAALTAVLQGEQAEATRRAKVAAADYIFVGWAGSAEAGASLSTGNSNETAVTLGFGLSKETVYWRHAIKGTADYRRAGGQTTSERFTTNYEPNWFYDPRFFVSGHLGWERDRFAGYSWRFTETLGLGWVAADGPAVRLELDGGPGLRQTRYVSTEQEAARTEAETVLRGSASMRWQIAARARFLQTVNALVGADNRSLEGISALELKVSRHISSRLSFTVRNESDPPEGLTGTDTISRVTLKYDF